MSDRFLNMNLRLSNQAIIQFDGPNLIRIGADSARALVSHKDIMVFLPDFFDWCHVGSFLENIPEGKEQILAVLKELYENNMFEVKYDEPQMPVSSEYKPKPLSNLETIFYNIHNHHLMIKDYPRTIAYKHAIDANVTPDDVVLEVGCGSGIQTFFAAKAGAKKLFAIEINENMIETVTTPLAEENNVRDKITFLLGNSLEIPADAVTPKATVFIAELLGDGIFNENLLNYTIDARDRFLAPNAKMIPKGIDVYLFAYENYLNQAMFACSDLRKIGQAGSSKNESLYLKYDSYQNKMLSEPVNAVYVDLLTIKEPKFKATSEFVINSSGILNGCCLYFVAHMDDKYFLANAPWSPQLHWTQQLFNINPPREVKKGERIPFTIEHDQFINLVLGE